MRERRHLQEPATQVRVGTAPRSMGAGGGRTVPGARKSSGSPQWPRNPAPEGPARCPTTQCVGLRLGQSPAGALVGLGLGAAPSSCLWSPPDGGTPGAGRAWAQGVSKPPASPLAHRHSAQQPLPPGRGPGCAEGTQAPETIPQRGLALALLATPQLRDPALSEPIASSRRRTSGAALAGTARTLDHRHRPGGRSRQTPRDEAVRVQRCSGRGAPHCLPPPDIPGLPRHPPGPTAPTLAPHVPVFSPHYPLLSPLSCQSKSGLRRGGPRCSLVSAARRRHAASQHQGPGLLGGA